MNYLSTGAGIKEWPNTAVFRCIVDDTVQLLVARVHLVGAPRPNCLTPGANLSCGDVWLHRAYLSEERTDGSYFCTGC